MQKMENMASLRNVGVGFSEFSLGPKSKRMQTAGHQALFTSSTGENPEGKVQRFRRSMRNVLKLKIASIKQLMIKQS